MQENYLVVPSIREHQLQEFLESWEPDPKSLIVVEDNPTKTFKLGIEHHYSHQEIKDYLGDDSWIISKKDSACRCFGYLLAYKLGTKYIFTLDDDTRKTDPDFFAKHISNLEQTTLWQHLVPNRRTRGLPYKNLGFLPVIVSVGLWSGVADDDAPSSLVNNSGFFTPPQGTRVMPQGFFPCSGMNMAFKSEYSVLFYYPLMGSQQPYSRFDDIFAGIIMKYIADHLRLNIVVGEPHVLHSRASDPFINLKKEASGIYYNETFYEEIAKIKLTAQTPKECIIELGQGLLSNQDEYLATLGKALLVWCKYY